MSTQYPDELAYLPDLSRVDRTIEYFFGLRSDGAEDRKLCLDHLLKSIRLWIVLKDEDEDAQRLLNAHLPTVLRLSHECPFEDVQHHFSIFLHDLRNCELQRGGVKVPRLMRLGPSAFIPAAEVVPLSGTDNEARKLFVDAFLNDCRVSHMVQLMGYHPSYLDQFVKTHHFLMRGDGPLPLHWRNYIAIMSAARHSSGYLVSFQHLEFLEHCREEPWLKDMSKAPAKLRNLSDLNSTMAHQPWCLNPTHMEDLLKPGKDSWSVSELVHAIVILAHFHALSGFALGCGINPEIDTSMGHTWEQPTTPEWSVSDTDTVSPNESVASYASTVVACGSNPALSNGGGASSGEQEDYSSASSPSLGCMHADTVVLLSASPPPPPMVSDTSEASQEQLLREMFEQMNLVRGGSDSTLTVEENQEQFECESLLSCELEPPPLQTGRAQCPCPSWIDRFVDDPDFVHEDFAMRGTFSGITSFRYVDYSWEGHGFSLVNRLYSDVGALLDEKFQCVSTMTYNTFGNEVGVDTLPMRRAIWNYIHCIKGIFHDDYSYSEVNRLLPKSFKTYIKTVTCFPERVGFTEFFNCLRGFQHAERVHINILLMEARFKAELLYALRALNRYITLATS